MPVSQIIFLAREKWSTRHKTSSIKVHLHEFPEVFDATWTRKRRGPNYEPNWTLVQTLHVSQTMGPLATGFWTNATKKKKKKEKEVGYYIAGSTAPAGNDIWLWTMKQAQRIIKTPLLHRAGTGESAKRDWRRADSGLERLRWLWQ